MINPFESYTGPGTAPIGCAPIVLPANTNPNCQFDYAAYEGELTDLFISPVEYDPLTGIYSASVKPTDWTSKASYLAATELDHLTIIGDKPLPEQRTLALAKRWIKISTRGHSINIDITDMSEENYEYVRTLQYGLPIAVWAWSIDGWTMGGENGIICVPSTAGTIWARGEGSLMTGTLVLSWDNKFDPPAVLLDTTPAPLTARRSAGKSAFVQAPEKLQGATA